LFNHFKWLLKNAQERELEKGNAQLNLQKLIEARREQSLADLDEKQKQNFFKIINQTLFDPFLTSIKEHYTHSGPVVRKTKY
jgi:hypothetical protein